MKGYALLIKLKSLLSAAEQSPTVCFSFGVIFLAIFLATLTKYFWLIEPDAPGTWSIVIVSPGTLRYWVSVLLMSLCGAMSGFSGGWINLQNERAKQALELLRKNAEATDS